FFARWRFVEISRSPLQQRPNVIYPFTLVRHHGSSGIPALPCRLQDQIYVLWSQATQQFDVLGSGRMKLHRAHVSSLLPTHARIGPFSISRNRKRAEESLV